MSIGDISSLNHTLQSLNKTMSDSNKKSALSFSKTDGLEIDPTALGAAAAAKFDTKIASLKDKIDTSQTAYDGLKSLFDIAGALSSAMQAITSPVTITTDATPDSALKSALTATAVSGAAPATHDVEVKQIADKERWVLRPKNNPCTDLNESAVWHGSTPGIAFYYVGGDPSPGRFQVIYTQKYLKPLNNTGPSIDEGIAVADINLENGWSMNRIVEEINSACNTAAIPVKAKMVKYDSNNNYYELVIESNEVGPAHSFQVVARQAGLFDLLSTDTPVNATNVAIFKNSNMEGWVEGVDSLAELTSGTLMILNGKTLTMNFDTAAVAETQLGAIATIINNNSIDTGVIASISTYGSGSVYAYLKLTSIDGSPINVQFPINAQGYFCNASRLSFTGAAPGAKVTIDGIDYEYPTNTITNPTSDISSMTLKKTGSGQVSVGESSSWDAKIRSWVTSMNAAAQFIAQHSQLDEDGKPISPLFGSSTFTALSNLLASAGSAVSPNLLGGIGSLSDMGISFTNYSGDASKGEYAARYLTIDETKFTGVISDPTKTAGVKALFGCYFSATASVGVVGGVISNNNPKLTLSTADNGFSLTDFKIKIQNLAGVFTSTATYQGQTYALDTATLGGNSLSLIGKSNTPFVGLSMIYSADTALNLNAYNEFDHITFKHGIFETQASILKSYLKANTGAISSAITNAKSQLSSVKSKLSSVELDQTKASEVAQNNILWYQMQEEMLDQMMENMMDMLFGKND